MSTLRILLLCGLLLPVSCRPPTPTAAEPAAQATPFPIMKSNEEWSRHLTEEQFAVLRGHGTEPPFRNAYWNHKEEGVYTCAGCGQVLFDSESKYDSGTGWPSFWKPVDPTHVGEKRDTSHGMIRTEVHCSRCGGHLGHVFPDGPAPTGLRYCINSASLVFKKKDKTQPPTAQP